MSNDCEIEQFPDGTNIFWFKDGRVRLEMPPSLPQDRKDKHITYIREILAAQSGTNSDDDTFQ